MNVGLEEGITNLILQRYPRHTGSRVFAVSPGEEGRLHTVSCVAPSLRVSPLVSFVRLPQPLIELHKPFAGTI
jgi:hypothetical protein